MTRVSCLIAPVHKLNDIVYFPSLYQHGFDADPTYERAYHDEQVILLSSLIGIPFYTFGYSCLLYNLTQYSLKFIKWNEPKYELG